MTISQAVDALRRGEVIGLPTETVYGLAADASNPEAVKRIFELKGRPADHPVIVHLASADELAAWAVDVPEAAHRLAAAFWPGPLTLILRKAAHVLDLVTGGQDTVGIRVPRHPVAQEVLRAFGGALAAPSANRFGRVSPTRRAHVLAEFGDALPIVLEGGDCEVGLESTIVDLSREGDARILRPGVLGRAALESILGPITSGATSESPRAAGTLASHYAPSTPVELVGALDPDRENVRVLTLGPVPAGYRGISLGRDPAVYGKALYAALRELDAEGAEALLVEAPPAEPAWEAVRDRLTRAATR